MRLKIIRLIVMVGLITAGGAAAQAAPGLEGSAVTAGVGFLKTDTWGLLRFEVTNPGSESAEPLVMANFTRTPTLQFGRRLWVPAESTRRALVPVRPTMPPRASRGMAFEMETRVIELSGGREYAAPAEPSLALARPGDFASAIIAPPSDQWPSDAIATLRESAGMRPVNASVDPRAAPPLADAWKGLDALVIAREDPELDAAQMAAIRSWLLEGGRLWIQLDQVGSDFPARLLGEYWQVAVLDRVAMTDFEVDPAGRGEAVKVSRDYPVDMVRIVPEGFDVTHTVRGYPAAINRQVGAGRLLVTTLHPKGWLAAPATPSEALTDLNWFVRKPVEEKPVEAVAEPLQGYVQAQIGYEILGRGPVILVLGGFTMILLLSGIYLARTQRLEYVGLLGAVFAVLAAGAMVGMGLSRQSRVPPTLAASQVVRYAPHLPVATSHGLVSTFQPQGDWVDADLHSRNGGTAWPTQRIQGGGLIRVLWEDPQTWSFHGLVAEPGAVQSASTARRWQSAQAPVAEARFTPSGLAGKVTLGEVGELVDAVVMGPGGTLVPRRGDDGTFEARAEDALAPGQYARSGLLNTEQAARQAVYRDLLSNPAFGSEPALVGWSRQLPPPVAFRDGALVRSEAVVVIPLKLQQAEPGETVTIPSAFLPPRLLRRPGLSSGTAYDPAKEQWIANIPQAMTVYLDFQLPEQVSRLDPTSADLLVDANAPGWLLEIVTLDQNNNVQVLAQQESPIGPVLFELSGESLPALADGGAIVGIRMSQPQGSPTSRGWSVSRVNLNITGQVPQPRQETK